MMNRNSSLIEQRSAKTSEEEIQGRIARVMRVCEGKFPEGFNKEELTEEDSKFAQEYYEGKWDIPKFKAELEAVRSDLKPSQIMFRQAILDGVKRNLDRR